MPKTAKLRAWTATDVHKLKGLAKKKVSAAKIARALSDRWQLPQLRLTSLV